MSYDTWLEGTLALDPFPDDKLAVALAAALQAARDPRAGRLVLTPLGHGIVCEEAVDWETAVAMIERARATIFGPLGVTLTGTLRAVGEDEAHLATVLVSAGEVRIERHDLDDDPSLDDWIAALQADDPELRADAAAALADSASESAVEALAAAARDDDAEAVRCRALESLGHLGNMATSALPTLLDGLQDPSPFVRYWATFALGRLGPAAASAQGALEKLTTDSADGPRFGAIDALRRIRAAG
jgi:hypothetical protein